ncbi:50S ribosomal protein L22 [Verrucomicrobiota bacterium]
MEVIAINKYARMSPSKAVGLARRLRGLSVEEALKITDFTKRKAAILIGKTLRSAVANAVNNAKLSVDNLHVKEAIVDAGPTSKRYWARARGMFSPVARRTCHIKIVLCDTK